MWKLSHSALKVRQKHIKHLYYYNYCKFEWFVMFKVPDWITIYPLYNDTIDWLTRSSWVEFATKNIFLYKELFRCFYLSIWCDINKYDGKVSQLFCLFDQRKAKRSQHCWWETRTHVHTDYTWCWSSLTCCCWACLLFMPCCYLAYFIHLYRIFQQNMKTWRKTKPKEHTTEYPSQK